MGPTMVDLVLSVNVYGVNCAQVRHSYNLRTLHFVAGMLQNSLFASRNSIYGIFVANGAKISTYMHFEDTLLDQISL